MSSFQYYELDKEGSLTFLELKTNEEKILRSQIPMPEVYQEARRTIKCIGSSDHSEYIKYLLKYQEYRSEDGKKSSKPTDDVKTRKVIIFKSINQPYIVIKGKKEYIAQAIEMLTESNILRVKYYSINVLNFCLECNINYSIVWTSGSTGAHGHYKKNNSNDNILLEAKQKGWDVSSVTFSIDNKDDNPKIRINSRGNIYLHKNFEESDSLNIVSNQMKKIDKFLFFTEN